MCQKSSKGSCKTSKSVQSRLFCQWVCNESLRCRHRGSKLNVSPRPMLADLQQDYCRQAGLWSGFHSSAGLWRLNMNCCKSLAINTPCGCTCGPLVGLKKTLKALHHFHESNMFPEPALDFSCCQLCPWPTECECSSDKEKKSLFCHAIASSDSFWRI